MQVNKEIFYWWAQICSKHVEDSNKHIIEEIVRQVGYLPELYEDARSEKYKNLVMQNIKCRTDTVSSPDDGHIVARNM